MSFHGHPHNTSRRDAIPDAAASFVSDTTNSIYSGVSNLTDNSNSRESRSSSRFTSRSDSSSLRRDREREGRCADCGGQTHEIEPGSNRKIPLNIEGEVRRGRCLLCNPLPVPLTMQHGQPQRHMFEESNRSLNIDDLEGIHSRGGSSVTQRYDAQDRSTYWSASSQAGHSSASRSVDRERQQYRQQQQEHQHQHQHHRNPQRRRDDGRSDASVSSAQSYNSGSAQSYHSAPTYGNVGSHQSQHSNSNNYPASVQSGPNITQSTPQQPPLEEFTVHASSRGEGGRSARRQAYHREQEQLQRDENSLVARMNNNMAIDEDEGESHADPSSVRSHEHHQRQQQQQPPDEEANIHGILASMQRYPNHVPTQSKSLHSLWVLSWDNNNTSTIGRLGGVPLILDSMRLHPQAMTLQSNGLSTLQNLAMDSANRERITECEGVAVIIEVMAQYIEDKSIQQCGCTVLANLADGSNAEQKSRVAENGGILAMMRAVDAHRGDESILRAAYQALRKLGYNPGS